ncbi:hypothetical protein RHSIM_Rhsim01G0080000 [Rhododendron simsii]|uniref:Transposase n=1 Tax=Rhododendron simsii TaxID=118357 RepID=A0A834HG84_RHOSS|nr:hypothetical protein RHSIM_Rhsim01G0080000 [Rhododendron simsii]
MISDALRNQHTSTSVGNDERIPNDPQKGPDEATAAYLKLLENANTELYPGCKNFTSLSFIVRLLHMKVLHKLTNKTIDKFLEFYHEAFLEALNLPNSYYEAQKITDDLGFTYKTWDACPRSCMLFRNEHANLDACVVCGESRWKVTITRSKTGKKRGKKRAAKQMRYIPLKSKLRRFFTSFETAMLMSWHADGRTNDGVRRHPADAPAWKEFDRRHVRFASDIRNIRLGLASDGFNPYGTMSITHSTWPVVLVVYNLPPWLCMKQSFFILSLVIDGPKGPSDKIDVYLQPLIEELLELWNEGELTFDASTNQMFQMHVALMWTINDFPAYANLSGWSTKGKFACPSCNKNTVSCWLKHGKKQSYRGHRRFLPSDHKFRKDRVSFDGTWEWKSKPKPLSGSELLNQIESEGILTQYKIFDLKEVQVPDGYASNISRRVRLDDTSIGGLKSHNNHILMQQLIPIAIRKALPNKVVEPLIELGNCFRQLCSKVNRASDLEYLEDRFVVTLCHLEKIFPPSFFDIMEHVAVHLAEEALIAGPVQFRWMYPFERFLLTLKQYGRNKAHPEASIVKGYLMEDCMNFCAQYLNDVETKLNRPARNNDSGDSMGRGVGENTTFHLDDREWIQAHRYILFNTSSVAPFITKDKNPRVGPVYYYGWLTDIVEIRYTNDTKYVMFKCDWIDNIHGKNEDAFKFTLVNFNHLLYREDQATNEPYILASQAEQVWYVPDPTEPDWQVVIKMAQRGLYDMHSDDPQVDPYLSQQLEENIGLQDEDIGWVREGEEGDIIDEDV